MELCVGVGCGKRVGFLVGGYEDRIGRVDFLG